MRHAMRHAIAAAIVAALPVAAQAQDRPQIFPTRDVAVTYRVAGQGQAAELTMLWSAAQRLMRMNMPQGAGYLVADHQSQRGFMVMEAMRMIMDVPMEQAAGYQRDLENARFTRGGTEKIAGTDCTVWRYQGQGQSGEACITSDGVMLRAQGAAQGQQGRMEAVRVVYAPQDASLFRRPQGYQTMQAPAMQPGMVAPGARPGTPR
ncbi:DUF4412 domain-containing protein [Roseomonas eburnea]|uniref:DUF4412 domain-containing protein n=1 Tax=Neoroseomonas eburnea TaxID=1346889 RepID=A0A9X9XCT3_9PROT|nr:DUF4412 domain-containing protein [Neoroseomonas eburnea]MBR0681519.1 DUF4412 domain-containing protein [Neoroseomonas eburnea]